MTFKGWAFKDFSDEELREELERRCLNASTPDAPKDTSNGTFGQNTKPEPTSKSGVPIADSGQSGLDERRKIADILGVPIEQVHRLEWEPEPDPGGKGMSKRELKTRFGL